MAKFLSGRQSNFNIGIKSYTESKTVLQTIGKVGIGTTNAGNYSLYVVGDANITDNVTAQNYYGSGANLTGISTFANASITNGIFSNIYVSGISTLGITSATNLTSQSLFVSGISTLGITSTTNLTAQQLNVSGIITASQLSTGISGTGININTSTISGPATLTIDPAAVGDNTGAVRIKGDLYVDGTQFIVNSTTIELADFNVGIATTVGTNALLDGAGIGIGSIGIRKTIQWENSSSSLKSSENFNLNVGKTYKINGTDVLSNTTLGSGVTNSSLTSVGTLGQLNVSGVSTLGTVTISSGIISATVGVVTYYGDGSNLQGVNAFNVINQDIISSPVFPTFASNTGVSSVGISTTKLVFVPASGRLGIGTTNPQATLQVGTAITMYGSTGIVSATAFYGDGSNLQGVNAFNVINQDIISSPVFPTFASNTGVSSVGISTTKLVFVPVSGNLGLGTTNPTAKLHVVGDGLFTGVVTATTFVGNIISGSTGTISIGNTTGISGQYLQSTGIGITWATFPTLRTTQTNTATAGQTSFGFSYNVNFLDVYVNGVKLTSSEYIASNGSSITLISPAFVNDIVEFISYNITSVGGGGGGGGASIIDDLSDVNLTLPPSAGENLTYDGYYWVNDYVVTATTTTTSQTTLHSLSSSSYRSVEYMIQSTQGSNYHVTKILVIHDGTTTYPTEYGTLYTNGSLGTFDADISGGNMRLRVTPSSSSSTSYKIKFTAIKV
jgi:hypothetical protein